MVWAASVSERWSSGTCSQASPPHFAPLSHRASLYRSSVCYSHAHAAHAAASRFALMITALGIFLRTSSLGHMFLFLLGWHSRCVIMPLLCPSYHCSCPGPAAPWGSKSPSLIYFPLLHRDILRFCAKSPVQCRDRPPPECKHVSPWSAQRKRPLCSLQGSSSTH